MDGPRRRSSSPARGSRLAYQSRCSPDSERAGPSSRRASYTWRARRSGSRSPIRRPDDRTPRPRRFRSPSPTRRPDDRESRPRRFRSRSPPRRPDDRDTHPRRPGSRSPTRRRDDPPRPGSRSPTRRRDNPNPPRPGSRSPPRRRNDQDARPRQPGSRKPASAKAFGKPPSKKKKPLTQPGGSERGKKMTATLPAKSAVAAAPNELASKSIQALSWDLDQERIGSPISRANGKPCERCERQPRCFGLFDPCGHTYCLPCATDINELLESDFCGCPIRRTLYLDRLTAKKPNNLRRALNLTRAPHLDMHLELAVARPHSTNSREGRGAAKSKLEEGGQSPQIPGTPQAMHNSLAPQTQVWTAPPRDPRRQQASGPIAPPPVQ
ncbi:uncharacterized protein MONBRDRAFT_7644 [Monosiga brevicollis MX1]|uniref:RING-type domain-containing protein n=1 Tax=Monosiga brevicollis TaxID=81824 RepID=A9UXW2_MONBE|nr:uncharacterized protein MONBRDRAFT_7644 [Monosiga brevicollis MX1]EDQ89755.1 predicted protein [Monosiga brevicollis MX1]|eukprot:XP_001745177.1 hypothetical protein [Monosiga brevicollis MX1]